MASFDLTAVITNQYGIPFKSQNGNADGVTTLGEVCSDALAAPVPNENDGAKKQRKGSLSVRISEHMRSKPSEPFNMTVEEVVVVKEAIGIAFAPVVVYRAFNLLDPQ